MDFLPERELPFMQTTSIIMEPGRTESEMAREPLSIIMCIMTARIQICIRIISTRADLQMICRMEKDPSILILIRRISRRVNVMWATGSAVTVVDF